MESEKIIQILSCDNLDLFKIGLKLPWSIGMDYETHISVCNQAINIIKKKTRIDKVNSIPRRNRN